MTLRLAFVLIAERRRSSGQFIAVGFEGQLRGRVDQGRRLPPVRRAHAIHQVRIWPFNCRPLSAVITVAVRAIAVLTIAFLAEAGSSSRYLLDCHFWSGHVSKKGPNTSEIWTRRLWSFGSTAWATTGAPVGWLDDDQLLQPYSILVQFPVPEFFVMSSFFSVSKDFDFFRRMFVKHAHYFSNSCKSGWLLKRFLLDDSFSGLMQPLICLEMNKPCGLSEAGLLKLLDLSDGWTDSTLILCLPW